MAFQLPVLWLILQSENFLNFLVGGRWSCSYLPRPHLEFWDETSRKNGKGSETGMGGGGEGERRKLADGEALLPDSQPTFLTLPV